MAIPFYGDCPIILNYVPIIGPGAAILIFLFAGSLTITSAWQALLPAALYGAVHVIEGETVTPMLLARRFTLNPVLVVFSFVFWFWLWASWRDPVSADSGHDQNRL